LRICPAFLAAAFAVVSSAVLAQGMKPAGDVAKLLLDNPSVRVTEIELAPGAKLPTGTQQSRLMYMLTDGALVFTEEGKRPYEMIFKTGEAVWVPAQARAAENSSDQDVRALIVEVKQPAPQKAPAKRTKKRRR
jgi:quercetin dioxygenase-like cupin family protein